MTGTSMAALPKLEPTKTWHWRGFSIRYQTCGATGPAVVMVHGFGASWGHWRKNLPVLGQTCRCFAIDLIGFGGSDKPTPGQAGIDYTFETWGQQLADFCQEVVGEPAFLIGNSIGCIVAMQAAVDHPAIARGIASLNFSLRLLHERKLAGLPLHRRIGAPLFQKVLRYRPLGHFFYRQIAKPKVVRKILRQAYRRPEAVTDELVDMLMAPTGDRGAADVFLAFTGYSQGPLPEDLLPRLPCSTVILWGTADPWEPIAQVQQMINHPTVEQFIPLEGLGHCPQDEAPEVVNPILQTWILRHSSPATVS